MPWNTAQDEKVSHQEKDQFPARQGSALQMSKNKTIEAIQYVSGKSELSNLHTITHTNTKPSAENYEAGPEEVQGEKSP